MSYTSNSGALAPFFGSWGAGNSRRVDGALGAAATLGLSIMILKLVAEAVKSAKRDGQENSTFRVVQETIKGLFQRNEADEEEDTVDSTETVETVLHKGSCHCRAVTFELAAPRILKAQNGPGKISYAHTRTRARNFQFVKGTDHLQIYYVSVPAGSEHGVEPTVGAHTFCNKCGVYLLHAPSPKSDILHVNVSCVDGGPKQTITWNRKSSLSNGVPVANQWEEDSGRNASTWANTEMMEDSTLGSYAHENAETLDGIGPSEHSWKSMNTDPSPSPGTPSTVATVGTDSMQLRSLAAALEQQDSLTDDCMSLPPLPKRHVPPLETSLSTRSVDSSPSSRKASTTPMMRDQFRYYMAKHLPSTKVKEGGETTASAGKQL